MAQNPGNNSTHRVLSAALEQTADAVQITDTSGVIEYVNESFELITEYARDEVIGLRPNVVKSGRHSSEFYRELWGTLKQGHPFKAVFTNRRKSGTLYYESKTITPIRGDGRKITHYVSTGRDISESIDLEKRLHELAYTDALTRLPNRLRLLEALQAHLENPAEGAPPIVLLFLDLEGFKGVNDTFGHPAGDSLLIDVARRLESGLRPTDLIARMGGDEFAILMPWIETESGIINVLDKVSRLFDVPFDIDGASVRLSANIGAAIADDTSDVSHDVLKKADVAMYSAKEEGLAYRFYSDDMMRNAADRFVLNNDLRLATERRDFHLEYQLQVSSENGTVRGAEALLRWRHHAGALISPARFIPALEDLGLLKEIGEWTVYEICRQLQIWRATRVPIPKVSINLNAGQLSDASIVEVMREALELHAVPPGCLEVEVVETSSLANMRKVIPVLEELKDLGVSVALDDFGTGFSALTHLKDCPVNAVKIDREFIADMDSEESDIRMLQGILHFAFSYDLEVIAEGVENIGQLKKLRELNCHTVQGFLLARPMGASDLAARAKSFPSEGRFPRTVKPTTPFVDRSKQAMRESTRTRNDKEL